MKSGAGQLNRRYLTKISIPGKSQDHLTTPMKPAQATLLTKLQSENRDQKSEIQTLKLQKASDLAEIQKQKKLNMDYEIYLRQLEQKLSSKAEVPVAPRNLNRAPAPLDREIREIEDCFNHENLHHVTLSPDNKTVNRRKHLSDGGLAFVRRGCEASSIDTFNF